MRRPLLAFVSSLALVAACATGSPEPENNTTLTGTAGLDEDKDGITTPADCDDKDPTIKPGAQETCNGKDDNCDGKIDEGFDLDGDGYAICATGTKSADCDDKDPMINPGAAEVCNNKDDNCDGKVDEGFDKDNDGYYACARGQTPADCDDGNKDIYPGATETCNGKDDDCDGKTDDLPETLQGSLTGTIDPHWLITGSASTPGTGWAQLTPDANSTAGGLFWRPNDPIGVPLSSYLFDEFEMTATFWINRDNGADGLAFAWIPGTNYNLGLPGGMYGIGETNGYGVVIDTYTNPGEALAPFLVVYDDTKRNEVNKGHLAEVDLPVVGDPVQTHTMLVKLSGGAVSVTIDGVNRINAFTIPGYVPFKGFWGFTASTGGLSAAHAVRDITMKFPNGQGCVP